jgi:uncharacterized membrane protein (DUF4010 family)
MPFAQPPWVRLVIALGIGLLIGAERERRKGTGRTRSAAGVRTFAITALAGGISFLVGGGLLVAVAAAIVGIFGAVSYRRTAPADPGLTSEMALFATLLLGALAIERPSLAGGLGVVVTALLAARTPLHRFLRDLLTEQEAHDALLFAAASLVILPLVPNHSVGPYGVLNPRRFWELVVLVMAISGAGYIALRAMGSRFGLALAGITGGFISAAATIGSMATRATRDPRLARPATAGAVLSSIATVVQMAIVLLATNRATAQALAIPLAFAGIAAVGYGTFFLFGTHETDEKITAELPGRPFSLKMAFLFAATLLVVLFLSAAVAQWLGMRGLILTAGLAGFADTHSAAIAVAALVNSGRITPTATVTPILTGLTTNSITKAAFAAVLGGRAFFLRVSFGLVLMILAAWAAFLFL